MIPEKKTKRVPALDFTKGALGLLMVFYHWLNYFVTGQGLIYRYIRFITPSFIFITGYLISSAYLARRAPGDSRLPMRLMTRGLKILALFVVLNVVITLLFRRPTAEALARSTGSLADLFTSYITGNISTDGQARLTSFYILVPIGVLLLVAAAVVKFFEGYRYSFHVTCVVFLACILILNLNGMSSANLELVAIGLLGVVIGCIPIDRTMAIAGQPALLGLAYAGYIVAITVWNVIYPLQIVAVCLNLALIYLLGTKSDHFDGVGDQIIVLGKYSLFGYIAQIGILRVLRGVVRNESPSTGTVLVSLLAALALTVLLVNAVDRLRIQFRTVDRLYTIVFA